MGHMDTIKLSHTPESNDRDGRFNSTLQRFGIKDKDKSNKFYLEKAQNIE